MKIILTLVLFVACIANAMIKDKKLMLEKISEIPPYVFHEESIESFQKTLKQGKFWVNQEEKTSYLFIDGDGIWGSRLFILDEKLNLYMFTMTDLERDDVYYELYTYDRIKKIGFLIGSFKQSLFVN